MPDEPLSLSDLPTTNPSVAYSADVTRLGRTSIGTQDDAWLLLAHALWRIPQLSMEERPAVVPEAADALVVSALSLGLAQTSAILRVAAALRALYDGASAMPSGYDAVGEAVFATQSVVEELEIAGGFALAYATLANLETAFASVMTPRMRGNLTAQQGRTLRQLGLMDAARELYTSAMEQGYECDAKDVVARGLLGLAAVTIARGNYPAARDFYERALANAEIAREQDLLRHAHHGLMSCGFASGDLDSAMVHGWNVLRLCIHPDTRAEALLNMAEICRLTGEHDAALRVFMVAIDWTSVPRVRLHGLSGALQTAITLQKLDVAARLQRDIVELMPKIADTYALAAIGIEFADALRRLGDMPGADAALTRASAIAVAQSYHELVHHAEQMTELWRTADAAAMASGEPVVPSAPPRKPRRSEHFKTVLRSLNGLTAAAL